jgi:glucose uptake protein
MPIVIKDLGRYRFSLYPRISKGSHKPALGSPTITSTTMQRTIADSRSICRISGGTLYQPETYAIALLFMVTSMLCWGSWANTVKLVPGYRFQLFYWDYVIGLVLGALAWGMSLGSLGSTGQTFLIDLVNADSAHMLWAVGGGIIFNVANLLLVAAIDIAGLAVAFPVGIGIALVVGAISSYLISPNGNAFLLFGGIALVLAAIACDAIAYRERERDRSAMSRRGVIISIISGLLMGSFYPFVAKAMSGDHAPGPYAVSMFFVIGVALCCLPVNYLFMRRPLDGKAPVAMRGYSQAPFRWHLGGILGGSIWCTGAVLNFVASQAHIVGPAVSYSIGQGATMISAAWGVFVWREFSSASKRSRIFLFCMFVLFLLGLIAIALAPILHRR